MCDGRLNSIRNQSQRMRTVGLNFELNFAETCPQVAKFGWEHCDERLGFMHRTNDCGWLR